MADIGSRFNSPSVLAAAQGRLKPLECFSSAELTEDEGEMGSVVFTVSIRQ